MRFLISDLECSISAPIDFSVNPNYTVRYTNSAFNQPVPNKGGIMLFDEGMFGIDLDEVEPAYYAGLLGKGTKNLPMAIHESESGNEAYADDIEYGWEFNSEMLPIKLYDLDFPNMGDIHFHWR